MTLSHKQAGCNLQVYTPQAIFKPNNRQVTITFSHTLFMRSHWIVYRSKVWPCPLFVIQHHTRFTACVCPLSLRENDIQLAEPTDEGRLEFRLSTDREGPLHDGAEEGGLGRKISKWNLLSNWLLTSKHIRNSSTFRKMHVFAFMPTVRWEDQYYSYSCMLNIMLINTLFPVCLICTKLEV